MIASAFEAAALLEWNASSVACGAESACKAAEGAKATRTNSKRARELMPPRAADVRAHERPDDESWAAYEQRLADAVAPSRAEAEAAPTAMPYQCACGRGFASSTLFKMHQRKCAVPPAAPAGVEVT